MAGYPEALAEAGIVTRFTGAAGFQLEAEGNSLLLDPFYSRISLANVALRKIAPLPDHILPFLPPKVAGILVGHTHFDHALDVGWIARNTGASIYGSRSMRILAELENVPADQINTVSDGVRFNLDNFACQAVASKHGAFAFGRVPLAGEIEQNMKLPARYNAYRCGEVFNYKIEVNQTSFYHVGSANCVHLPQEGADVAMLCVFGHDSHPEFLPRILHELKPKLIIPCHWDNFFHTGSRGIHLLKLAKLRKFIARVKMIAPDVEIRLLPPG